MKSIFHYKSPLITNRFYQANIILNFFRANLNTMFLVVRIFKGKAAGIKKICRDYVTPDKKVSLLYKIPNICSQRKKFTLYLELYLT